MAVQICPVCDGSGRYTPPNNFNTTACPVETICHGCDGKGWVTEQVTPINFELNNWNHDRSQFTEI